MKAPATWLVIILVLGQLVSGGLVFHYEGPRHSDFSATWGGPDTLNAGSEQTACCSCSAHTQSRSVVLPDGGVDGVTNKALAPDDSGSRDHSTCRSPVDESVSASSSGLVVTKTAWLSRSVASTLPESALSSQSKLQHVRPRAPPESQRSTHALSSAHHWASTVRFCV